jgi:hypothetical protein
MPAIKRFRPNMPSRKSADSRSARFAADPVSSTVVDETPQESGVSAVEQENTAVENTVEPTTVQTPIVAPIIEPGQLAQETITMPSSTIVRQPWKQENKQQKSYLGWVINSATNLVSFNVMLAVVAAGLAYYFFIYRKKNSTVSMPEVEEQTERKSEGPKSVRSSLKFKSPTMILTEIRKNPSTKVVPTIAKK